MLRETEYIQVGNIPPQNFLVKEETGMYVLRVKNPGFLEES